MLPSDKGDALLQPPPSPHQWFHGLIPDFALHLAKAAMKSGAWNLSFLLLSLSLYVEKLKIRSDRQTTANAKRNLPLHMTTLARTEVLAIEHCETL